ncbi:hypothetical protein KQX54_005576 [Cotesia glomerata]|uniref:Uncharacterized protein n=1 Tax=Cotesia glomerata TaxID=32391 RepID=A0AAV7J2C7_COTGL|nr:hypothetical protein KQX54_005576 [Cotesia glomerata]
MEDRYCDTECGPGLQYVPKCGVLSTEESITSGKRRFQDTAAPQDALPSWLYPSLTYSEHFQLGSPVNPLCFTIRFHFGISPLMQYPSYIYFCIATLQFHFILIKKYQLAVKTVTLTEICQ